MSKKKRKQKKQSIFLSPVAYVDLPCPVNDKQWLEYNTRTAEEFKLEEFVRSSGMRYPDKEIMPHDYRKDQEYEPFRISYEYLNPKIPEKALARPRNGGEFWLYVIRYWYDNNMLKEDSPAMDVIKQYYRAFKKPPVTDMDKLTRKIQKRKWYEKPDDSGETSYDYDNYGVPFWNLAKPRDGVEWILYIKRWLIYYAEIKIGREYKVK